MMMMKRTKGVGTYVYRLFVTNERSLSKEDKKTSLKRRERKHRTETLNISGVKN